MSNEHVNEEALQNTEAQEAEVTLSQATGGRNKLVALVGGTVAGGVVGGGAGAGIGKGHMGAAAVGAGVGATAGLVAGGLVAATKMR